MQLIAGALFKRDGRILLGLRSPSKAAYPNLWDLIGGRVEPGESVEKGMIREVQEEVGSTPTIFEKLAILEGPDPEIHGPSVRHLYLVTSWSGPEPHIRSSEHSELRWVSLEEVRVLALGHPSYLEIFEQVIRTPRNAAA